MREHLRLLAAILQECGKLTLAAMIQDALSGPENEFNAFLSSNELWGGAGSIADQAGVGLPTKERRKIESTLVQLGKEQIQAGKVNPRTAMWVGAFEGGEKSV